MASVFVRSLLSNKWLALEKQNSLTYDSILSEYFKWEGVDRVDFQFKVLNGSVEIKPGTILPWPHSDSYISFTAPLIGGKGGFGSMLRAIGAQIEKTTNREACRDLSGRRLRDINEEKRLKEWVAKQAEREKEREERKKRKLEKLQQEYRHEFHDPEYQRIRSEIPDRVSDAVGEGFKEAKKPQNLKAKREVGDEGPSSKKFALWSGVSEEEIDSDESSGEAPLFDSKTGESDSSSGADINIHLEKPSSNVPEMLSEVPQTEESQSNCSCSGSSGSTNDPVISRSELPETICTPEENTESATKLSSEDGMNGVTQNVQTVENLQQKQKRAECLPKITDYPPIDLDVKQPEELEKFGLDHLKTELQRRGLKCGGTLKERALRLFRIKGLSPEEIDPSLLAKPIQK